MILRSKWIDETDEMNSFYMMKCNIYLPERGLLSLHDVDAVAYVSGNG